MATLDTSMTNTALPSIAQELQVSASEVIGVVTIYQLVMVATMLPLAALAAVLGYKRVFMAGLTVFLVASLACGMAPSLKALEAARALQGLGAAALMACNIALVRHIYPSHSLGRGLGLNALVVATSLAGGPVFASALLTVTSWHWLFYVNVPLCLICLPMAARCLPQIERQSHAIDPRAALLCTVALGLLVHTLEGLSQLDGFTAAWAAVLTLLAWYVLLRREKTAAHPILPVDLFRLPVFALSTVTCVFAFVAQGAALVALPFWMQRSLALSVGEIGWLIAPWPLMGASMAPISGRLSDRLSASKLGALGLGFLTAGLFGLSMLGDTASKLHIAALMASCGFGFGMFLSPNQRLLMTVASAIRSAAASGVLGVARLLGHSCGAAVVAACFALFADRGASSALFAAAICALAGSVCSMLARRAGRMA